MAFSNPDPASPVVLNVSVLQNPPPVNLTRRFCKVDLGETNLTPGVLTQVTAAEINSIFASPPTNEETYLWLVNFFANNANGVAYVLNVGSAAVAGIAALDTFIKAGIGLCYHYACPAEFYGEATFATLVTLYSTDIAATYFSCDITHGVDPTADADYLTLDTLKAFFPVYPSAVATESAGGAMCGILASAVYDLSSTNQNTMLQYKTIVGVTPESLTSVFRQALTNACINFVGTLQNNTVIFNGRYADNVAFDYWYAWDTVQLGVQGALLTAIINGSNVPSARIAYNQDGIDKLLAIINGQGFAGKANGTITDFAESVDATGTVLVNRDTFKAEEYYTYIAANPTKYAAELYDGLSGIIRIGRFFRKVTFNVTLN